MILPLAMKPSITLVKMASWILLASGLISLLDSEPKSAGSVLDGVLVGMSVGVSVGGADVSVGDGMVTVGEMGCTCLAQADNRKINTTKKSFER